MSTSVVRWDALKAGDTIVCPSTKRHEQVISSRAHVKGWWFVRTNRHDHTRRADDRVERSER